MTRRRKGVVTDRRNFPWHVLNHSRVGPKLDGVSVQAAGIYIRLRCMAGAGHFDGSCWCGEVDRMKVADCVRDIARRIHGDAWANHADAAKSILRELRDAGLVIWGTDRVVYIVDFVAEQFDRSKTGAERTREYRERQKQGNDLEPDGSPEAADGRTGTRAVDVAAQRDGDCAPRGDCDLPSARGPHTPPPAPLPPTPKPTPTDSDNRNSDFGFSATGYDKPKTSHRDETRIRRIEESKNGTTVPSNTTRNGRGAGGGVCLEGDIYADDPVQTAMRMTGERGRWAQNTWAKKLREAGEPAFFMGLGEFRESWQDGIRPKPRPDGSPGTAGGMLMGIINSKIRGGSP
jgi:hypothetical protein